MTYYVAPHQSQLQPGASAITRSSGCTWTSGANLVGTISGGSKRPTPDQVHALLPRSEETNPETPGWSIPDLVRALSKYGTTLVDRSGDGFVALVEQLHAGHYIIAQGDSDVFADSTCSGVFNGDHCIGIHPRTKVEGGFRWWWIDDPICRTARWEKEDVLRRYVQKLSPSVRFGTSLSVVPQIPVPKPPAKPVHLRFGARALAKPRNRKIRVPKGRRAKVRTAPRKNARVVRTIPNGGTFGCYQVTDKGEKLGGSRRWFGNRLGSRWVHSSSF